METVKSDFLWEVSWELRRAGMAEAGDSALHYKTSLQLCFKPRAFLLGRNENYKERTTIKCYYYMYTLSYVT
jgi:hypothetical protein